MFVSSYWTNSDQIEHAFEMWKMIAKIIESMNSRNCSMQNIRVIISFIVQVHGNFNCKFIVFVVVVVVLAVDSVNDYDAPMCNSLHLFEYVAATLYILVFLHKPIVIRFVHFKRMHSCVMGPFLVLSRTLTPIKLDWYNFFLLSIHWTHGIYLRDVYDI